MIQVHGVAFSPSGDRLGVVSHGSIVAAATGGGELFALRTEYLPFNSCVWITESSLVAAVSYTHSCILVCFKIPRGSQSFPFAYS